MSWMQRSKLVRYSCYAIMVQVFAFLFWFGFLFKAWQR